MAREVDLGSIIGPQGETGPTGPMGPRGPQGETGAKGETGEKGDAFSIAKVYASVSAMNAGYATDGVKVGQFVAIETGNVNNADNAKLYMKGTTAYTFITDLSGAQGMTGPQGAKGDTGAAGQDGITPEFEVRNGHLIVIYE